MPSSPKTPKRPLRTQANDTRLAAARPVGESLKMQGTLGDIGGSFTANTKAGEKRVSYRKDSGPGITIEVDGKPLAKVARYTTSGKTPAERIRNVASSYVKNYYKRNSQ